MKKRVDALRIWIQDFRLDVIRMMRLKFITMAMGILIAVFLVMLGSINMIMKTVSESQSMHLLEQIARSERYDTLIPEEENPDTPEWSSDIPGKHLTEQGGVVSSENDDSMYILTLYRPGNWDQENRFQHPTGWDDRNEWQEPPDDWEEWQYPESQKPPHWEEEPSTEPVPVETEPVSLSEPEPESVPVAATEPDPIPVPDPAVPEDSQENREVPTEEVSAETFVSEEMESEAPTVPTAPPILQTEPPHIPREPKPDRWNVSITIDHFAIMADVQGNYLGIRNTEDYTDEEAQTILSGILENGKDNGMYGWLQFCREEKGYGTLLVITDKTSDQGLLNYLFRLTVIVGIIMLLALLVTLIVLSKWITEPVQTAFWRQKQFVSDAGHELKTPIAVLTANADILQDELGSNKWLEYMQEQISRMNQLVGDLLHLARMDNTSQEYHFVDFDLSLAIAATTLPFESAAFEQHRNLEMDVQPGVQYHGSEQHIRQLCAIFIDNALKYSEENGIIKVTLLSRGEQQILEFYNTGCDISPSETEKIFERFYRGDTARNSKGKNGYGLGLAIAKSIMDIHKIKIQVTCEKGKWIRFLLTM